MIPANRLIAVAWSAEAIQIKKALLALERGHFALDADLTNGARRGAAASRERAGSRVGLEQRPTAYKVDGLVDAGSHLQHQ